MELNDIQEMTLANIEKKLAENDKKILANIARVQKLLEENVQNLMEENKKLITESTVLNQCKTQKMLEETKARMFAQVEQVKGLDVATLFAPPEKAKSEKSGKSKNHKNANLEKSPDAENPENQNSGNFKNRENRNLEKTADAENSENQKSGNFKNRENRNLEKSPDAKNSENQNSGNFKNRENRNLEKTAETKKTTSAISENADSEIKYIKKILGLPEDATLAEVRKEFELKKNSLNDFFKVSFEKTLQSFS